MINDSLLRLFNSEFFNAWIAVSYIFKYPDNNDLQRYLCASLKKFPSTEIEFFLPQLMHVLVTQPSAILEETLIDLGSQSPHFAVMSIWYLETYMADSYAQPNSPSYVLCQRLLNRIQAILMIDEVQAVGSMKPIMDYMDDETPCGQSTYRQKLDATGDPISFGSNHSLSSSCSSLSLSRQSSQHSTHFSDPTQILAPMSFTMATDDSQGVKVFSLSQYLVNNMKWPHHKPLHGIHGGGSVGGPCIEDDTSSALDITTRMMGSSSVPINDGHPPSPAPFFSNVSSGNDYLTHKHPGIRHSLSLPYISHTRHQPDDTPPPHLPELESSSSTSSFLSPRASSDGSSGIPEAALLTNRGNQGLGKQHWSHYGHFQNEMQFLAALSDIAERLVAVPRHARTSTLQAELALINHRLPTEICLPLWCSGDGSSLHHHHVVRVSPYDAVVLNSAERAPYLLMVEVVEDDIRLNQEEYDVISKIGGVCSTNGPIDLTAATSPRHMRTAAVMLAQLQQQQQQQQASDDPALMQAIRQRVIDQMVTLEEQRMAGLEQRTAKQLFKQGGGSVRPQTVMMNKDDPSAVVLSEDWQVKKERIRAASPFGHLPNWRLLSVIVKQGADLRQEQFTVQLIREIQKIWIDAGVDAWVKYYRVLVTSDNSGLIETIRNTISIHSIKKNAYTKYNNSSYTLRNYFEQRWGSPTSLGFRAAQIAFMKSLVGYSIVCYLLQIKDRHNGNLLIDDQGHIIHIDFGFVLSNSPGSLGFEKAPFKLSQEYIDVLGGMDSELFGQYRIIMKQAFKAVRKYSGNLLLLVEMMSKDSNMPCFQTNPDYVLQQLKGRFQTHLTDPQLDVFVEKLIVNSCGSLYTRLYDTFQYYSQGVL